MESYILIGNQTKKITLLLDRNYLVIKNPQKIICFFFYHYCPINMLFSNIFGLLNLICSFKFSYKTKTFRTKTLQI